ncbi:MAG: ATP-binding protein [Bacillota bacterium]|nr:ATP-binding protein [Bacillota bacterium]
MRGKFIFLAVEVTVLEMAALGIIWKNNVLDGSFLPVVIIMGVGLVLLLLQGYFNIVKPYTEKVRVLEAAANESKEADLIRREFVANVTHELKTPLTSISGFIETLQAGAAEDPEIRHKFIDIIAIETARLKRLIEDLLVLSDIENRRDSEGMEFDIKPAIENTVEALKPIAENKGVEVILDLQEGLFINGSVDRFRQMMVNLIENAVKYSDEGGHIWIRSSKDADKIVVSVRDEGMGIAPEHHERLFERFYRVDKSRSKKAGGTGLGLSIVKHIAVLFGASLKVESQVGEGAEFFVVFNVDDNLDDS